MVEVAWTIAAWESTEIARSGASIGVHLGSCAEVSSFSRSGPGMGTNAGRLG